MMLDPFLVFEHHRVRLGAVQTATVPRSGRINAARSHAQTAQPASMARTRVDPPVAGWADPSQPFLPLRFPSIFQFLPPSKLRSITNFFRCYSGLSYITGYKYITDYGNDSGDLFNTGYCINLERLMPVIVMASPKGGVGKSTCAVLLATEFARMNAEVTVLDCDPNHSLTRWASRSIPSGIRLVSDVGRSEIVQTIKRVTPSQRFLSILPCCHPLNRYELPILDFQVFFRFVIYFR